LTSDPGFVSSALNNTKLLNGSADDYALQTNSSAVGAGRNGENIGAMDGRVKVGLLGKLSPPNPPHNLSITVQ